MAEYILRDPDISQIIWGNLREFADIKTSHLLSDSYALLKRADADQRMQKICELSVAADYCKNIARLSAHFSQGNRLEDFLEEQPLNILEQSPAAMLSLRLAEKGALLHCFAKSAVAEARSTYTAGYDAFTLLEIQKVIQRQRSYKDLQPCVPDFSEMNFAARSMEERLSGMIEAAHQAYKLDCKVEKNRDYTPL